MHKRVIIIVMDSVGIGELPDAYIYHDEGSDTIGNLYRDFPEMSLKNLEHMGLGLIDGVSKKIPKTDSAIASYGKMTEVSKGKDTTTGHWEIAGLILDKPFRTFPDGFPAEIIEEFKKETGFDILCNKPISGTKVLELLGEEHMKTKKLIVYTSADSVFQIAAHEEVIGLETLYDVCRKTRKILDKYDISRVIARPFVGDNKTNFKRTPNRRDFSMKPTGDTLLTIAKRNGLNVAAVGKIEDIYAKEGITQSVHTVSNADGIQKTLDYMDTVEDGIIFTNLVDFDSLFGHRNNPEGYKNALQEFDASLPKIMDSMTDEDLLFITADHGCDPTTPSTDHSREYVPLIVYSKKAKPVNLGIRGCFCDLAATAAEYLNIPQPENGTSFLKEIL